MNYEQKYKEALDLMKDCVPDENGLVHVHPEDIFSELAESEDEKIKKGLIENFKWFCGDFPETTKWGKYDNLLVKDIILDWLKSLKQKHTWKPTDGQMESLEEACDKSWEPDGLDPLYTLYEDLKKLKEVKDE